MRREGSGSDAGADMGPLVPTRESVPQSPKGGLDRAMPFRLTFGPGFYASRNSSRSPAQKNNLGACGPGPSAVLAVIII